MIKSYISREFFRGFFPVLDEGEHVDVKTVVADRDVARLEHWLRGSSRYFAAVGKEEPEGVEGCSLRNGGVVAQNFGFVAERRGIISCLAKATHSLDEVAADSVCVQQSARDHPVAAGHFDREAGLVDRVEVEFVDWV